ncbi:ABC-2 transporter permease [Bacillus niameyensis]|uniref:ABC-2 transporter permease n=1 Tax=Bacillus niameyensis TaxID=1522308 RepID=UPI000780AFA9|nr:ABC-2 transporter permease [Bacillus niameyensis]
MLQLIKKDITIHKFQWIMYFAMLLFFMYWDKDAIFIVAIISAVIIMNAFYADEQANGHKLWNALPFTRSEIVGARYLSLMVVTIISMSTVMIIELIMSGGWELSLWKQVVGSFVLMIFSGALCFPLFYRLAQKNVIFILIILYILLVIGGSYSFYYSYKYMLDTLIIPQILSNSLFFVLSVFLALCLYLFSWMLSIKIYKSRELV